MSAVDTAVATAVREVRERIAAAAGRAGRDPAAVTLVAATKIMPVAVVWGTGLAVFAAVLTPFLIVGQWLAPSFPWFFAGYAGVAFAMCTTPVRIDMPPPSAKTRTPTTSVQK